jgi:hypothetical protein
MLLSMRPCCTCWPRCGILLFVKKYTLTILPCVEKLARQDTMHGNCHVRVEDIHGAIPHRKCADC